MRALARQNVRVKKGSSFADRSKLFSIAERRPGGGSRSLFMASSKDCERNRPGSPQLVFAVFPPLFGRQSAREAHSSSAVAAAHLSGYVWVTVGIRRYSLKFTSHCNACRCTKAFTKYDSTKDGQLNIEELANALKVEQRRPCSKCPKCIVHREVLGSFSSDEIRHVRLHPRVIVETSCSSSRQS